jgi:2-hydroxycyclohexanecarboxyl-CoA dehydrogenase
MSTRTALVTGAANGIGKAISLRLARDRMAVGVLDIDLEGCEKVVKEIEAQGGKAIALEASVADRPAVQVAVQKLRERFGPVTVVVNNAGIVGFIPFEELTDEDWDRMLEVNLKGTFIVTQTCLPDMKEAGWGRIVNISSSSAQTGSETQAHYSASKGAMISLTRTLSRELGPLGITVNTIPPGSVMGTVMSEANRHRFQTPPETLAQMIPMRRTGVPEDIANACAFLVGKEAGYVTGQVLGVNGGRVPN